jgi:hypothetical protein
MGSPINTCIVQSINFNHIKMLTIEVGTFLVKKLGQRKCMYGYELVYYRKNELYANCQKLGNKVTQKIDSRIDHLVVENNMLQQRQNPLLTQGAGTSWS